MNNILFNGGSVVFYLHYQQIQVLVSSVFRCIHAYDGKGKDERDDS